MANIHDLAREYLAKDGLKIRDTQKAGVFLFADWLLAKQRAAQQKRAADYRRARGVIPWKEGDELPEDTIRRLRGG